MFKQTKISTERLEDDLLALRRRVEDLESASKRLELEWTETYDKVRHQMSRMAKRQAVEAKDLNGNLPPEDANDPYSGVDPVSKSIMVRRGMMGGSK